MTIHPAPGSSQAENAHALSFPAAHYAKLFPRDFLQSHLPDVRPSGREPTVARRATVHTGSLTHAHGSAVVRIGDTAAVCGVRGELLNAHDVTFAPRTRAWLQRAAVASEAVEDDPDDDDGTAAVAELGLLVPNIELATGCHPHYLPGGPPSVLAQSLTQRVLTLLRLTRLLSPRQLIVWGEAQKADRGADEDAMDLESPGGDRGTGGGSSASRKPMAFWTLYIDILLISLDGSALAATWSSALSALLTTALPEARWDADRGCVLCHPDFDRAQRLLVRGVPTVAVFAAFEPTSDQAGSQIQDTSTQLLLDPDDFEESCCLEEVTVVVDEAGSQLWRIEKSGGGAVHPAMFRDLVRLAGSQWLEWKAVLEGAKVLQEAVRAKRVPS